MNNCTELVTTGLNIKIHSKKSLYAGMWCFNEIHHYNGNIQVLPNIWNDRNQMYSDYLYLEKVHKKIIQSLSKFLNNLHNVNFTEKYWQVLLDPWLFAYLGSTYFRWSTISNILNGNQDYETKIYANLVNIEPVLDYDEYRLRIAKSHSFNHNIFSRIIRHIAQRKKNNILIEYLHDQFDHETLLNKPNFNYKDIIPLICSLKK